ncbi:MAG: hypothetical protein QOJ57_2211 [Thermoleophilaceae bacterium]|nr:hypothetical protein [Thermoleophilaceae bacterium]
MVARRALPVLIALLPAAVPATASAAFAQRAAGSGVLMVTAGGEVNTVTITLSGGTYTIKDSAGMGAGANCDDATPGDDTVTCPASAVATFSADLGAGNDKFVSTAPTPAQVLGGGGVDDLTGGAGADELIGGPENDTLRGGDGKDKLVGETTPGDAATGNNTMDGGNGDDTIDGGAGSDTIGGGADHDTIEGGAGADTVDGGSGDDLITPGAGPVGAAPDGDALGGGTGIDEVRYAARTAPVIVTLDGAANDGQPGEQDDVRPDVEKVTGGSAGDELRGSLNPETLSGGPGGDLLDGGGGADTTDGGDGNDVVNGGDGSDLVSGGSGDDQLNGSTAVPAAGAGKGFAGRVSAAGLTPVDEDTLDGGDGNDTLDGGPGADRMSGGAGVDTASYATAKSPVVVTLDGQAGDGEAGEGDEVGADVENLAGWRGVDTFTGSDLGNAMSSGGGEDYLDGAGGADSLTAGTGFDVIRARDGVADTVNCGRSSDFAIVDKRDLVSGSCERTDRGLVKRPRLGRFVLLSPLRGGEAFGLPGMHRTVPLKDRLGLPPGVKLDATRGAVRLTAANGRGRSQSGDFSEGAFLVKQDRSARGLTELALTGGDLTKCTTARRKVGGTAARTVLRRLFGRARGRFRTRGRFSTATVRGTEWTVIDRCDGTLTTVERGTVVVRDRVKHRTVRLKSGERYLARRGNR